MTDLEKKKLRDSIATIRWFLEEQCVEKRTASVVVKEDGSKLYTDWGYFYEGLDEIEKWLERRNEID